MSTGLELLPLALAAGVAIAAAARRTNTATRETVMVVETRLRDESVLSAALAMVGTDGGVRGGLRHGTIGNVDVAFSTARGGPVTAYFGSTVDAETARRLVLRLDAAYCDVLRERVMANIREQAAQLGLTVGAPRSAPDGGYVLDVSSQRGDGVHMALQARGTVAAETFGTRGAACLPWVDTVERLTNSSTIHSRYTSAFSVGAEHEQVRWRTADHESEHQVERDRGDG